MKAIAWIVVEKSPSGPKCVMWWRHHHMTSKRQNDVVDIEWLLPIKWSRKQSLRHQYEGDRMNNSRDMPIRAQLRDDVKNIWRQNVRMTSQMMCNCLVRFSDPENPRVDTKIEEIACIIAEIWPLNFSSQNWRYEMRAIWLFFAIISDHLRWNSTWAFISSTIMYPLRCGPDLVTSYNCP